jgi:putative ABC transport system permease protein
MKESILYAWREITRRRLRTAGIIAGYAVAAALMVFSVSLAGFSIRGTGSTLEYTGAQFIGFVYSTPGNTPEVRFNKPENEGFLVYNYPVVPFPAELVEVIRRSPNVKHASPLLAFTVGTDDDSDRTWILAGFDPSDMEAVRMASCSDTDIVEGRFLEPGDRRLVLLEQTFADAQQHGTGDMLSFGDLEFTVAGILSPGTRPAKADIYMPYYEAIEVLNTRIKEPVRNIANVVLVDGISSILTVRAQNDVREILGYNSSTLGYGCFNPAGAAIGITLRGMRLTGLAVFLTIFIFIAASQYFAVVERRREIGVLKAIGWSDRDVVKQEMAGSFIQSAAGSLAGCTVAILFLAFMPLQRWLGIDDVFSLSLETAVIAAGFGITVVSGTIAGAVSATMTLRLKPAKVLRTI